MTGPTGVSHFDRGDMWMTGAEVCKMIRCTQQQLYKLNAQGAFPIYKRGKHNLYLYSQVQNWMMNQDTSIRDDPAMHRNLGVAELPRTWPPSVWPIQQDDPPTGQSA